MGVVSDALKRNLDAYHSSTERTIELLTKENSRLRSQIKLLQKK